MVTLDDDLRPVLDEVAVIVSQLRTLWDNALLLQAGRESWQRLRPALDGYGLAATFVRTWYRDSTLAACRRLIDATGGTLSLRRTLERLARIAPTITAEVVAEIWSQGGHHRHAAELAGQGRRHLSWIVSGEVGGEVDRLTKAAVRRDSERLTHHTAVQEVAHNLVGHVPAKPVELPTVTEIEVDALSMTCCTPCSAG